MFSISASVLMISLLLQSSPLSLVKAPDQFPSRYHPAPISLRIVMTATADEVRALHFGMPRRMRIGVFNWVGERVYESEVQYGSAVEWNLVSLEAQRLPDGQYDLVVTLEDASGRRDHRREVLLLKDHRAVIAGLTHGGAFGSFCRLPVDSSSQNSRAFSFKKAPATPTFVLRHGRFVLSSSGIFDDIWIGMEPSCKPLPACRDVLRHLPHQYTPSVGDSIGSTDAYDRSGTRMLHPGLENRISGGTVLWRGTPVHLRLIHGLSSKKANVGDTVKVQVAEDVTVNQVPVILKGSLVEASVAQARPASWSGQGGVLGLQLGSVSDMFGRNVKLTVEGRGRLYDIEERGASYDIEDAFGEMAAVEGGLFALPYLPLAHLLTRGDNVSFPVGYELVAEVKESVTYSAEDLNTAETGIKVVRSRGAARVHIYRPSQASGKVKIYVDGSIFVLLPSSSVVETLFEPMWHTVRYAHSEIPLDVKFGGDYFILVDDQGKSLRLIPSDIGLQDVAKLKRIAW